MTIGNFAVKANYTLHVFLVTQVIRKPRLMYIPKISNQPCLDRASFIFCLLWEGLGVGEGDCPPSITVQIYDSET